MVSSMPGRCTFTTTRSPAWVVARWVCAMEAVARGSTSNSANSSPSGEPSPASMDSRMVSNGNGLRVVLELLEGGDHLGGQQVAAHGEDLARA